MRSNKQPIAGNVAMTTGGCCSSSNLGGKPDARSCCGGARPHGDALVVTDPMCGMTVDPTSPPGGAVELHGSTVYFCSTFCRAKFVSERGLEDR